MEFTENRLVVARGRECVKWMNMLKRYKLPVIKQVSPIGVIYSMATIISKTVFDSCQEGTYGEGNGTPLQYSCLENPMDRGAWQTAVHWVAKSRTGLSDFTFTHWRRKWHPTPVFLPGESQGRGSLVGCRLWGRTESDTTEATQQQQQQQQQQEGS